jgi:formylglycine-generating enzyme required for sulfatase activity
VLFFVWIICGILAASGSQGGSAASSAGAKSAPAYPMVLVQGGTFRMGSPDTEPGRNPASETRREVTITKGFYIGKYPVTQDVYESVMGFNPSFFASNPAGGEEQGKRPVEQVSWYDAIVFCNTLSALTGLSPVYEIKGSTDPSDWGTVPTRANAPAWDAVGLRSANGYRLPTDAEWEYACRAGTTTAFNCGTSAYAGMGDYAAIVDPLGWYAGNCANKTHEVGKKSANAWGLYDMHGNVYEWCGDWTGVYGAGPAADPAGPASGVYRMVRGGRWGSEARYLRSASWGIASPWSRISNLGFRLVRSAP